MCGPAAGGPLLSLDTRTFFRGSTTRPKKHSGVDVAVERGERRREAERTGRVRSTYLTSVSNVEISREDDMARSEDNLYRHLPPPVSSSRY
jgi:hypothetical protein